VLDSAHERLLPNRLLRDRPRGRRRPWGVRRGDGGAPCIQQDRDNDLSTPVPETGFPGLQPGDRWCLCAARWKEALDAGVAPGVVLRATHENALEYVSFEELKKRALDLA
jgi:hypothetical protein